MEGEEEQMKTISILNLKGGVAKSFTAANMAYELWRRGYKVLLLDNDKQGNLSKAYGRYEPESVSPVARLLAGDWQETEGLIQPTDYEGMDILTANMSLFPAVWNLAQGDFMIQYKKFMGTGGTGGDGSAVQDGYDFCIIDNPPDIGANVASALAATDEVIVPVKIDENALEGLDVVAEQVEDARAFNPALTLLGILVTVYQNTDGEKAGLEWLRRNRVDAGDGGQGRYPLLGIIRYSRKVAESSFLPKPIYEYSPCCGAAQDYKKFVTAYTGKGR